jgi:hypothetical protein
MTRMLLLATVSLAATTLPLPAQTPNGPMQSAVQGTVKGTAMVGQGVVQGTGQAGQGIAGIGQRSAGLRLLMQRGALMIENAELDRLLTQVNCRITSIARLRDAGAISNRKAVQELNQAVELRAKFMRQIDRLLPLTPRT